MVAIPAMSCRLPYENYFLSGGLNPVAYVREMGIKAKNRAMSTVMDYQNLTPFSAIYAGMKRYNLSLKKNGKGGENECYRS